MLVAEDDDGLAGFTVCAASRDPGADPDTGEVWSFADNERGNRFYEANGFAPDGAGRTEEAWAHIAELRYRRTVDP